MRTVLCVLALMPRRLPGLPGGVAGATDALGRVLVEIEYLKKLDTDTATSAACAAHSAAQILLALATGDGSLNEHGDGVWWLGEAMRLIGTAQGHVTAAHVHARRPGRAFGSGREDDPKSAFIEAELQAHWGLKDAEIAQRLHAHDVDPGHVGKVRRRLKAQRLK